MSKFNVGDIVYLNSGSPPMTVKEAQSDNVEEAQSDYYACCWTKSDGAIEQAEFDERCITKEIRRL